MRNMDALSVSARLEANKTLEELFSILRDYGELPAALWLNGDQEMSRSYAEMARRAEGLPRGGEADRGTVLCLLSDREPSPCLTA